MNHLLSKYRKPLSTWGFYFFSTFVSINVYSSPTLNILNWDDYLSEETIAGWESLMGAKVQVITYDDEDVRDLLLTDTTQNLIDLAIVDSPSATKLAKLGYVVNLKDAAHRSDIEPNWLQRCGDNGVPYLWGTLGIAYREDKIDQPINAWADLFSGREDLEGHIGMLGDYYSMTAPALIHLNLSPNTDKEDDLKAMFELLRKQTNSVLTYVYAPSYLLNSANKDELYAAVVYSGDQFLMNDTIGKEVWRYVLPDEPSIVWLDCWVIPFNSEKQSLALSFIEYIGQANIAAKNSEEVGVATVNRKARSFQSKEMTEDELIYPREEGFDKLVSVEMLSDANIRQRIRIQEAIKVIHESK
ncbi:ABC transporter substrate-binding protein [Marinomonas foliarum]|uniref:Spermidine/putrescine ABC transporter substrate-binding protein n=1 Tax=Marinomonas foliarum TaxID=491950 RepID=A0ABX7INA6_9GAMM|nr:spermidine/putrescine ABC transporter substrate-binding protein [Marinomonas foliarum]QRV23818.1 spermidine/putrescine ABC transporter substrate-binding protein [Marinomonas foliarum]